MEKKSKKSAIIGVTCLLLVTLILLGLTYAYYRTRIIGNENTTISVTSKKLELTYQDGSANIEASGIEPSDMVYTKTFSVKNTGSVELTYSVYLIDVINTFERKDDIKYTLVCSAECNGKDETTFPSEDSQLVTNTIASDVTHTYTLSFTYKDNGDQSVDMGKKLSAKIQILEATTEDEEDDVILFGTETLANNVVNNVKNGDLEGKSSFVANLNATNMVENKVTSDDKILSTATDDYGTTYYFRENVIDNYVNYAGMCWRIVRIQGDGSIKLILASELECSETNVKNDSGFATNGERGVIGSGLSVSYGYKIQNNAYLPDYINAPEENEESARTNLNAWLNTKITSEEQTILKNEQWCIGDLTNVYDDGGQIIGTVDEVLSNITENFGFIYRSASIKTPSFICETTGKTGEIDTNKIGMLTYDEAVYAGGDSISNFLYQNASGNYWWMLSPYSLFYDTSNDMVYGSAVTMDYEGFFGGEQVNYNYGVRPVVSLKSGVEITGGLGTQTNPYVIKGGSQTKFLEYIKSTGLQSEEHPYEKYITYAYGYTFDENTGTFSLVDPNTTDRDSATPLIYNDDTRRVFLATTTVQDDATPISTTGLTEIYEVTEDLGSSGVKYNVIASREA